MSEELRTILYPLGFIAQFFFTLRFFIQWFLSERAQKSYVTTLFWKISILGNGLLMLHGYLQGQFHLCLIQSTNLIISWRNLNLMQFRESNSSIRNTLLLLLASIFMPILLFSLQIGSESWFRIPRAPWQANYIVNITIGWHILGFSAMLIFASRFWIQWIDAERKQESHLGPLFWWTSLIGSILSLIYFIFIADMINIIGYGLGSLPYIRNLMLIKKSKGFSYE